MSQGRITIACQSSWRCDLASEDKSPAVVYCNVVKVMN